MACLNLMRTEGIYNPFPTYSYTGSVRPVYPLSARRTVPKSIPHPDWAETGIPKAERRLNRTKIDILDAKGQEAMRKVCKLSREVLDIVAAELKPGITTDYLDEVCHKACVERNVSAARLKWCCLCLTLTVVSFSLELQPLSQIALYISERSCLSRNTRPANPSGWRYHQSRHLNLP